MDALTEIEQFYLQHRPLVDKKELRKAIEQHIQYRTITVLTDQKGISGMVRFNVFGDCASICDLLIRDGLENKGLIKLLVIESWHKFPYLQFFRFERQRKYKNRPMRAYRLARYMKGQ